MNKKRFIYFSFMFISVFIVSTMCFSYAFFTSRIEGNGKLNIVAGTLEYKLESNDLENNTITVAANSMKKITFSLTNLNDTKSKYEIYYQTDSPSDLTIGYGNENSEANGILENNEIKKIDVYIRNTSSASKTITFNMKGSLIGDIITLESNENKINDLCVNNNQYGFNYIGNSQNFITPCSGNYKVELWGAAGGGNGTYIGGNGAYVSGNINLDASNELYVYVGEYGNSTTSTFNNGSRILYNSWDNYSGYFYTGGGSTDIRLVNGNWNDFTSIKSRIIVAGAGGGASSYFGPNNGGAAGGLIGYNGNLYCEGGSCDGRTSTGAGQTYGGINGLGANSNWDESNGFGILYLGSAIVSGGNGYYAGGNGAHGGGTIGTGAGGSSFISGHNGCDAITSTSTSSSITHTGQSIHYSGYTFTNTVMIDGAGYIWTTTKGSYTGMPTLTGSSTMVGNTGNGYAKITYLGN